MKPIRGKEDFKGAIRKVKNGQIWKRKMAKRTSFKGDGSLDTLLSWSWERLKVF